MKYAPVILMLLLLNANMLYSQAVVSGIVVDSATGEAVGGASIRIVGTTRGTYTKSTGMFRLPLTEGATTLSVRSIGYKEATVVVGKLSSVRIALIPSDIRVSQVTVIADITPEEVVRRAINRKEENAKRITSLVSTLYSKMNFGIKGEGLALKNTSNNSITETISRVYDQRVPTKKTRVHILQRRQTKNIGANKNLAVFDDFYDFMSDEIIILETRLVTPLSRKALDEYQFRIVDKKPLGDQMVYEITFEPRSRLYPGFEGRLTIIEGTYQVIAAEFSPTDETAFPFIKGLKFSQRFEKLDDTLWVPMYQHGYGLVQLQVLAGILEMTFTVDMEAYVTEVEANTVIPDSVFEQKADSINIMVMTTKTRSSSVSIRQSNRIVTVEKDADSIRPEFWENHSYTELSDEEREAYRKADSIVSADSNSGKTDTSKKATLKLGTIGPFGFDLYPAFDRSHITGFVYGGGIAVTWETLRLSADFGLGQKSTRVGSVGLQIGIIHTDSLELRSFIDVYSRLATIQPVRPLIGGISTSNQFYAEYFDYYRQDGWKAGMSFRAGKIYADIELASSRHINMPIITGLSRSVLTADSGSYRTITGQFSGGEPSLADDIRGTKPIFSATLKFIYGIRESSNQDFGTIEYSVHSAIPTFATGYRPMYLDIFAGGGAAISDKTPNQYLFTLMRRFPVLGRLTDLSSVNINSYRGSEYQLVHIEHNFTDIWWRGIGIPTFPNKRGLDLIGIFGAGRTSVRGETRMQTEGWKVTSVPFMEAGFALARIPTFISDFFFLRFDAMWPLGLPAVQTGRFGWTLTLSTPLL